MSTTGSLNAEHRRAALLDAIQEHGAVRLGEAAERLDVSEMTIRRDLEVLEADGLVRRVRGGAARPHGPRRFSERSEHARAAKARIAEKVLPLVPRSGAIALDASTTVAALAERLTDHDGLSVVSNSWDTFAAVRRTRSAHALLTGGEADELTDSLVGPLACRAARELTTSMLVTSASGVHPGRGSTDVSLAETQVKREFAAVTERVVLLADSSKFEATDVALAFSWPEVSLLVTELDPQDERLAPYRDLVELR